MLATPVLLTICLFLVRWDSKAPKKSRATLIQSAFLWTQFYETQLHIHRMFALKEPPDPDLSVSSMIICRFAAKRCIAILESVRDVMIVPLHFFLLIVSPRFGRAVRILDPVSPHA